MFRALREQPALVDENIDFWEVAPENWIDVGGRFGREFRTYAERFPIVSHGLSLSIGGPSPLDLNFLESVRAFLDEHNISLYSDHLSACSDHGHLYDLMPIPFTEDAVRYVASRIRTVQEVLERKIAVEHVSYYAAPGQELSESEFINAVLTEADCNLLLDVNNAYVNSVNFGYDPYEFIDSLPILKVTYIHIAGHFKEAEDLRVDTHAAAVADPVWQLLEYVYQRYGTIPTLLERDFNFPAIPDLISEVTRIKEYQQQFAKTESEQIERG
ncbi:MAG: DUF692 domain-containing protein [Gammaproteobacteria bacterium]|nr:DUF692 domain-containing protein [Gammaproteobacteria bacterium]